MRALILKILLVTAALTASLPAVASHPVPDDVPHGAATNWIVGHRLLREGDFASALPYLHLAYRAEPEEPLIALDFQRALAFEGYLADAISVMDALIKAEPDSSAWRLRRAGLNLRTGQTDDALRDLRELRRRGQVTFEVIGTEAAIHLQKGRVETALDAYRDGLELLPERRAAIYIGMARILEEAGRLPEVPPLMEEALAAEPTSPGLWVTRIRTQARLERYEEALASATRADREIMPRKPLPPALPDTGNEERPMPAGVPHGPENEWPAESFRVTLADDYARHGDVGRAVAVLEGMLADDELGLEPSLWLARMLLGTGRREDAAAGIERVVAQWPDAGRAWFLKGKLAESDGDWATARQHHLHAVKLAPYDPELRVALVRAQLVGLERSAPGEGADVVASWHKELHHHSLVAAGLVPEHDAEGNLVLGYAFRILGEYARAAERFATAGRDPNLRLTALVQQSICLDDGGRSHAARRVLATLRDEYPGNAEVANSYGYFLAEKNQDLELAEELVREALTAEPNNGAYLDSLGWVHFRLERFEDAFDLLVQAVNILPEDPVVLEHLGRALGALGRSAEARSTYERALANGGDAERLEQAIVDLEESVPEEGP